MEMEEDGSEKRTRSFRYEDYNIRRVFLRSYPLHWDEEQEEKEDGHTGVKPNELQILKRREVDLLKQRLLYILRCGAKKVSLLRNLKDKIVCYLITCHPLGFSPSASSLSV